MEELKPKKCETRTFGEKMNFYEARDKALDITEKEKIEVLFDYNPDQKDKKHIWQFIAGSCEGVNVPLTREDLLGQFHTHYLEGRTSEPCAFSGMDLVNGLGKENTIGCFFGNRNVKYRREYQSVDLRFKNFPNEKVDNLMSYMVNRLDHQFHTQMSAVMNRTGSEAQQLAPKYGAEEKCWDYVEAIEEFYDDIMDYHNSRAMNLEDVYYQLGQQIMTSEGGILRKREI